MTDLTKLNLNELKALFYDMNKEFQEAKINYDRLLKVMIVNLQKVEDEIVKRNSHDDRQQGNE